MEIRSSPRLAMLLALPHGLALVAAGFVPWWLGLPLAVLILGRLFKALRMEALRQAPGSIVFVRHEEGESFLLQTRQGSSQAARLEAGGYVAPWLTVLRFKDEDGGVRSLLLMPDAVDTEDYRRFRIQAKRGLI